MRIFLLVFLLIAGCNMVVDRSLVSPYRPDRALLAAVYDFYDAHGRWPSSVTEFPTRTSDVLSLEQYRVLELETEPNGQLKITYEFVDRESKGWVSLVPPEPTTHPSP